jgi:hypothetical protein
VCLWFCEYPSGKPSRANYCEAENDSPSPWGEGRGEGGRKTFFQRPDAQAQEKLASFLALAPWRKWTLRSLSSSQIIATCGGPGVFWNLRKYCEWLIWSLWINPFAA